MPDTKEDAIERLFDCAARGHIVIPFLGSGVSASSGIMMGEEISSYLTYIVSRILTHPSSTSRLLLEGRWPTQPSVSERTEAVKQLELILSKYIPTVVTTGGSSTQSCFDNLGFPSISSGAHDTLHTLLSRFSPSSGEYAELLLLDSLKSWKSSLSAIARAKYDKEKDQLQISEHLNQDVVDRFNSQLVAGSLPNLTHKMLAHLADACQIRTVLTTNFDDLTENAFAARNRPLTPIEVPVSGRLPGVAVLPKARVIVKLHGGRLQTRADLSLDDPAAAGDKDAFVGYIKNRCCCHNDARPMLLVIGYSGSDKRCMDMIKAALLTDRKVKLLWISHTPDERSSLESLFPESDLQEDFSSQSKNKRIWNVECDRPDLLLYESFQRITRSIPSGGYSYRFSHRVPPYEPIGLQPQGHPQRPPAPLVERLSSFIVGSKQRFSNKGKPHIHGGRIKTRGEFGRSCWITTSLSGASRLMSAVFHSIRSPIYRHWFELQDYSSPEAFLLDALRALAIRRGVFDRSFMTLVPVGLKSGDPDLRLERLVSHLSLLFRALSCEGSDCCFFIYARDCPGGSAGLALTPWSSEDQKRLWSIVDAFNALGSLVVVITSNHGRQLRLDRKCQFVKGEVEKQLRRASEQRGSKKKAAFLHEKKRCIALWNKLRQQESLEATQTTLTKGKPTAKGDAAVIKKGSGQYEGLIEDFLAEPDKCIHESDGMEHGGAREYSLKEFLYAITLFRQSRHASAFYCEAVYPCPWPFNVVGIDNDEVRFDAVSRWMKGQGRSFFQKKTGGFFWIHRDMRLGLQQVLETRFDDRRKRLLGENRARIHYWIGDWYRRSFLATRHSVPAIESLYHFLRAYDFSITDRLSDNYSRREILVYRIHLAKISLNAACKILEVSQRALSYWVGTNALDVFKRCREEKALDATILEFRDQIAREEEEHQESMAREVESVEELAAKAMSLFASTERSLAGRPSISDGQEFVTRVATEISYTAPPPVENVEGETFWTHFEPRFESLGLGFLQQFLDPVESEDKLFNPDGPDLWRGKKAEWVAANAQHDKHIENAIQLLSDLAFTEIMRIRYLEYSGELDAKVEKTHWRHISWLCHLALDLCRDLSPELFDIELHLSVSILNIYGLSLSGLSRYVEAHRRFGEARGLQSVSRGRPRELLAMIEIRRSEAYILELRNKISEKRDPGAPSRPRARPEGWLVDAAFLAAIDAENALRGASHSSLEWSLIPYLKLRAAALGLRSKAKSSFLQELEEDGFERTTIEWARAGVLASGDDHLRKLLITKEVLQLSRIITPDGAHEHPEIRQLTDHVLSEAKLDRRLNIQKLIEVIHDELKLGAK